DVLRPLVSVSELAKALASFGELLGLPGARLWSLLDPSPLARTLRARVPFERIRANVASGELAAAAVVPTSARSGDTVVFHDGGGVWGGGGGRGGAGPRGRDPQHGAPPAPRAGARARGFPGGLPRRARHPAAGRGGLVLRRRPPPEHADQAGARPRRRAYRRD